jgi:hypothetical protein
MRTWSFTTIHRPLHYPLEPLEEVSASTLQRRPGTFKIQSSPFQAQQSLQQDTWFSIRRRSRSVACSLVVDRPLRLQAGSNWRILVVLL